MSDNENSKPAAAILLHGDTDKHLMASAFLIGDVLKERGVKDDKNIIVYAYPSEANKTKMDQIIKYFGMAKANIGSHEKAKSLKDKLKACIEDAIKNNIHIIYMPNTVDDFNESPQEMNSLINLEATTICNHAMNQTVDAKKPKDDKEAAKLFDKCRISPSWRFAMMDDAHIENQIKQNTYGLKKIFYPND